MVQIGTLDTKVLGNVATLTIGSDLYAIAENFSYDQGYREIVEAVPGTPTQIIGPGSFLGEFECDIFYSTDISKNLMTWSAGDLAKRTVVITVGGVAWTAANVRIFRQGGPLVRKDGGVRMRLRGLYPAPAT